MYYGGKNESCELSIILWRFGCTTPRNNGQSREAIKLLLSLYLQRTHCNHEYTYWERILECCWRNQAWINSTLSDWSWFDQAELDYQFVHGLMIFLFFSWSIDPSNGSFKRKMKTALPFAQLFVRLKKKLYFYTYTFNFHSPPENLYPIRIISVTDLKRFLLS